MKKLYLTLLIAALFSQSLSAQEDYVATKAFYVELGGPAPIMSVNFDSRFKSDARLGFGYRLGVGFGFKTFEETLTEDQVTKAYYSVPIGVNHVFGKPQSAFTFEVGGGISVLTRSIELYCYSNNKKAGNVIGHINIMYRYMPVDGGLSFRVGFTPIIGTGGDLIPMVAISIGSTF
jgi:hypothetical protein